MQKQLQTKLLFITLCCFFKAIPNEVINEDMPGPQGLKSASIITSGWPMSNILLTIRNSLKNEELTPDLKELCQSLEENKLEVSAELMSNGIQQALELVNKNKDQFSNNLYNVAVDQLNQYKQQILNLEWDDNEEIDDQDQENSSEEVTRSCCKRKKKKRKICLIPGPQGPTGPTGPAGSCCPFPCPTPCPCPCPSPCPLPCNPCTNPCMIAGCFTFGCDPSLCGPCIGTDPSDTSIISSSAGIIITVISGGNNPVFRVSFAPFCRQTVVLAQCSRPFVSGTSCPPCTVNVINSTQCDFLVQACSPCGKICFIVVPASC